MDSLVNITLSTTPNMRLEELAAWGGNPEGISHLSVTLGEATNNQNSECSQVLLCALGFALY